MGRFLAPLLLSWMVAPAALAWDCAWGQRVTVTLSTGSAAYTGEIRIDLSSADIPADYVFTPAGDDVRVFRSDNATPVDHIVTDWSPSTRQITLYANVATLAANSSEDLIIYLGNGAVPPLSDALAVFPDAGLRLQSRITNADPTTAAEARAAFASASEIYNQPRTSISGANNRSLGGSRNDFAWCVSGLVEVTPATQGNWGFRYGADFGRGGDLYVGGVELEQQWNDDLWWANNFNNTNETLEGSINLTPGWYRYEAVGFEGCCDGPVGWQARAPGGAWQDMTTANFSLRAAQCVPPVSVAVTSSQSCSSILSASKSASVTSDPMGSPQPYAISGSVVSYEITLTNPGQAVDAGTLSLTDVLPTEIALIVEGANAFELIQGPVGSGLSLNWGGPLDTTDDVAFSTDGVNFNYTPMATGAQSTDSAVTHVRFTPQNAFTAYSGTGSSPSATLRFSAVVE